jgi:hypothetical protein
MIGITCTGTIAAPDEYFEAASAPHTKIYTGTQANLNP